MGNRDEESRGRARCPLCEAFLLGSVFPKGGAEVEILLPVLGRDLAGGAKVGRVATPDAALGLDAVPNGTPQGAGLPGVVPSLVEGAVGGVGKI